MKKSTKLNLEKKSIANLGSGNLLNAKQTHKIIGGSEISIYCGGGATQVPTTPKN